MRCHPRRGPFGECTNHRATFNAHGVPAYPLSVRVDLCHCGLGDAALLSSRPGLAPVTLNWVPSGSAGFRRICLQPFCSAQTKRGRPVGRPLHCLARVRLNRCNRVPLGEIRSQRGDDPVCRTRRLTMRHWITSFRLLDEDPQYSAARSIRKAGRRSAGQSAVDGPLRMR